MDPTQTKIIELLREVHLIAFKETERLNMRIAELENHYRPPTAQAIPKPVAQEPPAVHPAPITPPSLPDAPELLNEHQVAKLIQLSVAEDLGQRFGPKIKDLGTA